MRLPSLLVMTIVVSAPLAAQQTDSAAVRADTIEQRRPARTEHEDNPYLREVDAAEEEPHPGPAPSTARRGPVYLTLGLGAGQEAFAVDAPTRLYSPHRWRPTLQFQVGGSIGQTARIGLEGLVWFNFQGDGLIESIATGMVGLRLYPIPKAGFYVKGAGGFGHYSIQDGGNPCGCDPIILSDFGMAWSVGAGIELPLGRGVWLGPTVELAHVDMLPPVAYRERVFHVGLAITLDHGHGGH